MALLSSENFIDTGLTTFLFGINASMRARFALVDHDTYAGALTLEVLKELETAERLISAQKTLFLKRAADTNVAAESGAGDAAEFLAGQTGESTKSVRQRLNTATKISHLPKASASFANGDLSSSQADAVADGGDADPEAEDDLLNSAKNKSLAELQREAKRLAAIAEQKANAETEKRKVAAKRNRRFSIFPDPQNDQQYRIYGTGPIADMPKVKAALGEATDKQFRQARKDGRYETQQNYQYDAFVNLLTTNESNGGTNVKHQVIINTTADAFFSGVMKKGDYCETRDGQSVRLSDLYDIIDKENPLIRILVSDGEDLFAQATVNGRKIKKAIWDAAIARYPTCANPLCGNTLGLQIDHRRPVADKGPPLLRNLIGLCGGCHEMKTHHGWCIVGPFGEAMFVKRRENGDGGVGYPLNREENPADYLQATKDAAERYPGKGQGW